MSVQSSQLPSSFRRVAWIALVVTGLISFRSLAEAMSVFNPLPPGAPLPETASYLGVDAGPGQILLRAQLEAAAGLQTGPWGVLLMMLSFMSGLASVSALRLLYPAGLPREGMRVITGGTLLIAGILRTIDGSIQLVLTERTAAVLKKQWGADSARALGLDRLEDFEPWMVRASLGLSVLMVGTLIGAAQYLRSARAKEIVRAADAASSQPAP